MEIDQIATLTTFTPFTPGLYKFEHNQYIAFIMD
jgi:hypothetical protein